MVALGLGWAHAEARADGLDAVRARGVLRWGGDLQGGEPYVFEDPDRPDAVVGFEVEIADALARALGVKAQFVQNDWSTLVPSLERGTFDIVLNGLEATPERRQRIRLSRPYYVFAERLSARVGERRFSGLASLRGARVGTLASSLAWDMLGRAGAERVPYEGQDEPYRDLAAGRIDAVLMDDIIADRYGKRPGLAVVGDLAEGEYAIGLRPRDQALAEAVDAALASLLERGELRKILERWKLDGPRQARLAARPAGAVAVAAPPAGETAGARAEETGTAARPAEKDGARAAPSARGKPLTASQLWLFVRAAGITLVLSAAAMALAMFVGLLLALARLPSRVPWRRALGALATAYVEVFRGTPVLLQLYIIYFGLGDHYALGPFTAAVLGLGLNYAAYEAEIYRAGLQAVPRGQIEAAEALGMTGTLVVRRVLLPQAFRFSLPGVANDFIALLKDSSLVSVITIVELTKRMTIVAVEIGSWLVPGLLCAALYLAMSYPLSLLARRLERALGPRG
jgi:polar amino acid transport system substrate-binding protein